MEPFERIASRVDEFRRELRATAPGDIDTLEVERRVHALVKELGVELMREVFQRADAKEPEVVVHGEVWGHRREVAAEYHTSFGALTVSRGTYQRSGRGRVMIPMDRRLGIVEDAFTPRLARILARATASIPSEEAADLLGEVGVASVSVSTLHRLPRAMAARLEQRRVEIEAHVRMNDPIPALAVSAQASLDGVMVPMEGEHARARGRKTDDPEPPRHEQRYEPHHREIPANHNEASGRAWHEAAVATLSYLDAEGRVLKTTYLAEMPEPQKLTLARRLRENLTMVLAERPELNIVAASDGAPLHWRLLAGIHSAVAHLHTGTWMNLVDFYHVTEYLNDAADAIYGEGTPDARVASRNWGETLRAYTNGAERVLKSLRYHRKTSTKRKDIDAAIEYLCVQKNAGRANFAEAEARNVPIGTGVTEAAAKTVVSVRMKRAGARFSHHGGQTILHFRAALLSQRFALLMDALERTYGAEVTLPTKAA